MQDSNAGSYQHLVRLLRPVRTTNERAITVTTWRRSRPYHAGKRGLSGREFFEAAAAKQQDTVVFYLRRGISVDASMRLLHDGAVYEIYSVRDVERQGAWEQEIRTRRTEVKQ